MLLIIIKKFLVSFFVYEDAPNNVQQLFAYILTIIVTCQDIFNIFFLLYCVCVVFFCNKKKVLVKREEYIIPQKFI